MLNYNNWQDTIDCLKSIYEIDYEAYKIYLVDNSSTNDSYSKLLDFTNESSGRCKVLLSEFNGGFSAGNNVGIKAALADNCQYILILNNDTIVTCDFLTILVNFAENCDEAALFGPKIVEFDDQSIEYGARRCYKNLDYLFVPPSVICHKFPKNKTWCYLQYKDRQPFLNSFEIEVLSGSCMFFKRVFFDKTGLLDETTFLYFEEFIIYHKAKECGFKTFIVPESLIFHKGGKSTAGLKKNKNLKHFIFAGRYFMVKYQKYSRFKADVLLLIFYVGLLINQIKPLKKSS